MKIRAPFIIAICCGVLGFAVLVTSAIITHDYLRDHAWKKYQNFCMSSSQQDECTVFLSHVICAGVLGVMAGAIQILSVPLAIGMSDPIFWCAMQFIPFLLTLIGFILPFNSLETSYEGNLTGFLNSAQVSKNHSKDEVSDYNSHCALPLIQKLTVNFGRIPAMFWFRIAIILLLTIDLTWAVSHIVAILLQITYGEEQQSMINDPGLNGTIVAYVFILIFQFSLVAFVLVGYILCYKVWRNRYQMDHKLRKLFIIWVGGWAFILLGNLGVAIYCLVRGKDPEGQLGFMYEMFQKHAIDRKFVSTFERYQRDHQCCGIYSPEDWLLVTLRATPGGGTGAMMMGGAASMDYGIQQNPSTGKCYMLGAAYPMGCGPSLMKIVNHRLTMYAGLMIVQVVLGIVAAVVAWYCFFYWLEKEVIVIPEDEVSNIIVIEPSDSDTSTGGRKPTLLITGSHRYGSGYLRNESYRGGSSGLLHMHNVPAGSASQRSLNHNHNQPHHHHAKSIEFVKPPGSMVIQSQVSTSPFPYSSTYNPYANLPPGMMNSAIPLHHNSYIHTPLSRVGSHHHQHLQPAEKLEKQLKTIGGKVLAEMHVDHNLDEDGKPKPIDPDADPKKQEKKKKHATIAIVRNQHKNDPPPKGPPGKHGQTGQLAEDIAAMSGKNAVNKIEDVVIEDGQKKKRPKVETPEILGSVTGVNAGSALEGILHGVAVTKAKQEEKEKEKEEIRKHMLIKPHYVNTTQKLHGHVGSGTGNEKPGMDKGGIAPGLGSRIGPYHRIDLDKVKTHFHNVNDGYIPIRNESYLRSAQYLHGASRYLNPNHHGTTTSVRSGHYMHNHQHGTVRDIRSGHYMNGPHHHSNNRIHSAHYMHQHNLENPHHIHSGNYLNQPHHHQHHGNPNHVHSGQYLNPNHHHGSPPRVHSGQYMKQHHHHGNPAHVHSGQYLKEHHHQHHHGNPNHVHSGKYLNNHDHHQHHQHSPQHHHDLHVPHYMKKPATLDDLRANNDPNDTRHPIHGHNKHDRDKSNNDIINSPNTGFGSHRDRSRYLHGGSSYLPRNDRYMGARESYLRPDRYDDEPPRRRESNSNYSIGPGRKDRYDDRDRDRGYSRNYNDDAQSGPSYRKSRDRDRERDKERQPLREVINERVKDRQKERERKSEAERKKSENRRKSRTYSKRSDDEPPPTILYKNPKRLDED